jgi:hypothetical protein
VSIRSDAKNNIIHGGAACGVTLTLTEEHWNEAKQHSSQRDAQIVYIKSEVAAGCHEGCKCTHGMGAEFEEPDRVIAACKADPTWHS